MSRPDPPGDRRVDPPGERVLQAESQHAEPETVASQYAYVRNDDDDDDDNSEQSVPRNDYDDYEREENDESADEEGNAGEESKDDDDDPPSNDVAVVAEAKLSTGIHSHETTTDKESEAKDPILNFEPDYTKIDAISFFVLCNRLEKMLQQRNRKTNRQSKDQVFTLLIDDSLRKHLKDSSWFPLLRLVMPDVDTSRPHTGMKERNIAMAWGEAFDLTQGSRPFERLLNFSDPTHFGQQQSGASDLSLAVYEIVEPRDGSKGSKLKIKHINELLDELVALKGGTQRGNHDWRDDAGGGKKKGPPLKQKRRDWVKQLRDKKLSALEHKWIVRILLQKMEIGFSSKSMLSRWMPGGLALELYRMNNSLKSVCTTLSNPHWLQQREEGEKEKQENLGKVYVKRVR